MNRDRKLQSWMKLAFLSGVIALCLSAGQAHAQRRYVVYRAYAPEKAGSVMLNFRGGLAAEVDDHWNYNYQSRFFGELGMDLGFAVTPDLNGYLILTPQVQLQSGFYNVAIPFGFQYDIHVAYRFYLYPRVSLGYSALIFPGGTYCNPAFCYNTTTVFHGGTFIPEFGLKWVINGRLNIGFEPFSLPIWFNPDPNGNPGFGFYAWYRVLFFIGGNLG